MEEQTINPTNVSSLVALNNTDDSLDGSFHAIYTSVLGVILVVAILANFGILIGVASFRKLRNTGNIFVCNLCLVNLLEAFFVISLDFDESLNKRFVPSAFMCDLYGTIFFLSIPGSAISILLLTADRFVAIVFPFSYQSFKTRRAVGWMLAVQWAYTILVSCLPVLGLRPSPTRIYSDYCDYTYYNWFSIFMLVCNFLLPVVFIIIMNISVYVVAERCARRINQTSFHPDSGGGNKRKWRLMENVKAAKRLIFIQLMFVIGWLPYTVSISYNLVCYPCQSRVAFLIILAVNYSQTAVNPLVYSIVDRRIFPSLLSRIKTALSGRFLCSKVPLTQAVVTAQALNPDSVQNAAGKKDYTSLAEGWTLKDVGSRKATSACPV